MKENTKENILSFVSSIKGLLFKRIRIDYGYSQREIATLIDRSEVSVRNMKQGLFLFLFLLYF